MDYVWSILYTVLRAGVKTWETVRLFFFNDNINIEQYGTWQTFLVPSPHLKCKLGWILFQQDSATCHIATRMTELLYETFGTCIISNATSTTREDDSNAKHDEIRHPKLEHTINSVHICEWLVNEPLTLETFG